MILDLASLSADALETDVCIVGAGAAGLTLAHELMGSGLDVVLLESGGRSRDASADALNEGEAEGFAPDRLVVSRVRGLGGTTQVWPGRAARLAADDFEQRAWVPYSGWPFGIDAIEPHYLRAERFLGIPAGTATADRPALSPRRALGARLRGKLESATDLRVVLDATATTVAPTCVTARSRAGRSVTVHARRIILCAGGIENPRLLLLSGMGGETVGRYFLEHPAVWCGEIAGGSHSGVYDEFGITYAHGVRYTPLLTLTRHQRERDRLLAGYAGFVFNEPEDSPMNAAVRLWRRAARQHARAGAARDLRAAVRAPSRIASRMRARALGGRPRGTTWASVGLLAVSEQAPDPGNRVELSSSSKDVFGMPRARVVWNVGEREQATHVAVTRAAAAHIGGRAHIEPSPWLASSAWRGHVFGTAHHMGATRISSSPAHGVVDADLRVHGSSSVFVCGSSVFPTSGVSPPTLTIVALAMRLADLVKSER